MREAGFVPHGGRQVRRKITELKGDLRKRRFSGQSNEGRRAGKFA